MRISLKRAYADGTIAVDMDPLSLLSRLAASVPPPRFHTVKYAGVLASASPWRSRIGPRPEGPVEPAADDAPASKRKRGGYRPWAELLKRTFGIDVLECPTCHGRRKLVAMLTEPTGIRRFLAALGEPTDVPARPRAEDRRTGRAWSSAGRRSARSRNVTTLEPQVVRHTARRLGRCVACPPKPRLGRPLFRLARRRTAPPRRPAAAAGPFGALPVGGQARPTGLVSPTLSPTLPDDQRPVVYVDWCDAFSYCQYLGRHLCGKIGGGPNALDDFDDEAQSEWFNACTAQGTNDYPYGNVYAAGACNGDLPGIGLETEMMSAPCQGGAPGLFNMSGNAGEWEDSCDMADQCRVRGGTVNSDPAGLACVASDFRSRTDDTGLIGIRCCL